MSIFKKIIALSLLGGSIAIGILIIRDSHPKFSLPESNLTAKSESPNDLAVSEPVNVAVNTTSEIAKNIAEELIKKNPDGPVDLDSGKGIGAVKPEELAGKVLSDQFSKLDLSDFNPQVNFSALRVVNSANKANSENYLKNFQAILKNNFAALDIDFGHPTSEDFKRLAGAYQKSVSEFYSLLVPQGLASIHSEQIRLMSVQKSIFNSLAGYEEDPMKALVAIQLSKEVDKKLADLKSQIAAYITKNGLKI